MAFKKYPHRVSAEQRYVLDKLLACREPSLGSHAWHCRWCGHTHVTYNACHNRHCPSCGGSKRAQWLDKVLSWSLPTTYLHVVFTQPHELIPLILVNPGLLYRLFFEAVKRTLSYIAEKYYGVRTGWVMVLHTWGQRMNVHVHIHVVFIAGGLSLDDSKWIPIHADDDAMDEAHLGELFREFYVKGLYRLLRRRELVMPARLAWIREEEDLARWLQPVVAKRWRVHCQPPPPHCQGPEAALKYLARYVVGSAISDHRIVSDDGQYVVTGIKNYRKDTRETRRLSGEEFVTRYLFHILPRNLQRVRYGGLYSSYYRKEKVPICRELLEAQQLEEEEESDQAATSTPVADEPDEPNDNWEGEEDLCDVEDQHNGSEAEPYAPTCPRCLMPGMVFRGRLNERDTYAFLEYLQWLWSQMATVVTISPCNVSGSSSEPLERSMDHLVGTITTLDIDAPPADPSSLPLPDT